MEQEAALEQRNAEDAKAIAEALKVAGQKPRVEGLEDFNPIERIPTISVESSKTGEGEWKKGMTLSGYYLETNLVTRKDQSTTQQHVLRLENGAKLGIWSVGSLRTAFERFAPGEYVSITYNGIGAHPTKAGQTLHNFTFKRQKPEARTGMN